MHEPFRCSLRLLGALIGLVLLRASAAGAVPTSVTFADGDDCDDLSVPAQVEELGNPAAPPFGPSGAFPADEAIASTHSGGAEIVCQSGLAGFGPIVQITNLTTTAFGHVWYVGDSQTAFTNVDGLINGMAAFEIDSMGANAPLLGESVALDGIFAPGETWSFVIAGYDESCGYPQSDAFGSIGVPTSEIASCRQTDLGPTDGSTGSIIATAVPEPGTLGLVGMGLCALAAVHRASRGDPHPRDRR